MDNHFVPNLTFGPAVLEAIAGATDLPVDAHLMIEDADRHAPAYVEAGAGSVTFHVEAANAPVRLAREIRAAGARASMALKPATPIDPYEDLLAELDMVLLMTVEPGFGGQKFLDLCLPKIRRTRELVRKHGLETWVQVDGGSRWRPSDVAPKPAPTCSSRDRRSTRPTTGCDGRVAARRGGGCGRLTIATEPQVVAQQVEEAPKGSARVVCWERAVPSGHRRDQPVEGGLQDVQGGPVERVIGQSRQSCRSLSRVTATTAAMDSSARPSSSQPSHARASRSSVAVDGT